MSNELPPWVPKELTPPRELTDRDYAEGELHEAEDQLNLDELTYHLAEARTYLDLMGHTAAATRLADAAAGLAAARDELVAAIKSAYDALAAARWGII
jgi:hypothetical protein